MCRAMYSASRPTPPTNDDASELRKNSPTATAGLGLHYPLVVDGLTLLIKYVEVNPVERRSVAGAPYDIGYVHDPAVFQNGRTALHGDRPRKCTHPAVSRAFSLTRPSGEVIIRICRRSRRLIGLVTLVTPRKNQ